MLLQPVPHRSGSYFILWVRLLCCLAALHCAQVFFCKYNDPIYVKMEKLEIMIKLANDKNIDQVLLEFKEYAQEVDVDFVRKVGGGSDHAGMRYVSRLNMVLSDAALAWACSSSLVRHGCDESCAQVW